MGHVKKIEMSRLFEREVSLDELKPVVDSLLGEGATEKEEWDFSIYGFTCHSKMGLIFFTLLDRGGKDHGGCISNADLLKVVTYIKKQPNGYSILTKPQVIRHLESITGVEGVMRKSLGRWYLSLVPKFSIFNNTFSLSLGYTDAVDNFEVYFMSLEDEPQEYVPLSALLDKLDANGFIVYKCGNCRGFSSLLLKCRGGCGGEMRYCSKECQVEHWKEHKKDCKKLG